jgi:hypothetical protein
MFMEKSELYRVIGQSSYFLEEYGIEHDLTAIETEAEWTDLRYKLKDQKQMERIHFWLRDALTSVITGWPDIEISAPVPYAGKEDEIRIRIYELAH